MSELDGEIEDRGTTWWRRHGIVGVASLVTLAIAVAFTLFMGQRSARQLAEAQCDAAAERSLIAVNLWTRITNAIEGDTPVEQSILDYIIRCNPPRDCDRSLIAPSPPDDCFTILVAAPPTTTG